MAKPLDPVIGDVLRTFGFGKDAVWDCHGTWVVYHKTLEQIAAKAGIVFDMPEVLEANGAAKSVALCVRGSYEKRTEWSVGEASPQNCKNAYPYAMAEKRAKDRVVLKLIGLHGLAYSEEEADAFKEDAARVGTIRISPELHITSDPPPRAAAERAQRAIERISELTSKDQIDKWEAVNAVSMTQLKKESDADYQRVFTALFQAREQFKKKVTA